MNGKTYEKEIEVRGHLIDSMVLTKIFDKVMDLKGDFEVLEFTIGKMKEDYSHARLLIRGNTSEHLNQLLESLYIEGAQPASIEQIELEPA